MLYSAAGAELSRSPLWGRRRREVPPQSFITSLVQVALAAAAGEPVLLLGPTGYKSLLVETLTRVQGRQEDLVTEHLTGGTCLTLKAPPVNHCHLD